MRGGGVADPAVKDDADVELDDVGVLDAARAADAVDDLVVDRNADVAGKSAVMEEGAASAPFVDQARGELVDLAGGDAGHDGEGDFLEDFAGGAATDAHALDFVRRFDGNAHGRCKYEDRGKRSKSKDVNRPPLSFSLPPSTFCPSKAAERTAPTMRRMARPTKSQT